MSAATATKTLLTADEFYDFVHRPENEDRWFELVRGEVIELPPPIRVHGAVCGNIARIVGNYTFRCRFGYITTNDSGVILERDPDTVRGPDVALLNDTNSNKFAELHPKYGEIPPILAVEVITSDTKIGPLDSKIDDYLDNGVKLVWRVDPDTATVRVYQPGKQPVTLKADQELDCGDDLPGFRCKVADFFLLPGDVPTASKE